MAERRKPVDLKSILTDDQIRTAITIGLITGKPVGGFTPEDLKEELAARSGSGLEPVKKTEDTPQERPPLRGIQAAAEFLGCSYKTVDRNLERIPHYKVGRKYYFQPEALEAIKKQGGV